MQVKYKGLNFQRLGHASVKISDDNIAIYIDPWSDVMEAEESDANLVVVTHDDFDHYDTKGIDSVSNKDTKILVYEKIDTSGLKRNVEKIGVNQEIDLDNITIKTVPAYNREDGNHIDENGEPYHAKGEVIGIIITIGGVDIFYPSDTDFLPEHEDIKCEVFIPPIGGHYTMNREEAANFSESTGAELVLPVHYDTFEAIETDGRQFKEELEGKNIQVKLF